MRNTLVTSFRDSLFISPYFFYVCIAILVSVDRVSKYLFCTIEIFNMSCVLNTGSAWGLFSSIPYYSLYVGVLGLLLCIVLFYFKEYIALQSSVLTVILLCSGVLANSIDRLVYTGVYDMISIPYFPIFATFNLADVYLSLSVLLFIFFLFTSSKHSKNFKYKKSTREVKNFRG